MGCGMEARAAATAARSSSRTEACATREKFIGDKISINPIILFIVEV
jgi:hypothetical protein